LANRALEVRFAAICHDFGKGLTSPANWPSHRGHEISGLEPIKQLCQHLKVPNSCRELALLVCEHHTHCHQAMTLRPKTLLKVLDALDAWRKPARFEQFLQSCEADFKGRTDFEHRPYPQADHFRKAYQAAQSVEAATVVSQGYRGAEIKEKLKELRQQAIAKQLYPPAP
jgi:tRNA nucleotidyltransferase (CCA-adding enzyme)